MKATPFIICALVVGIYGYIVAMYEPIPEPLDPADTAAFAGMIPKPDPELTKTWPIRFATVGFLNMAATESVLGQTSIDTLTFDESTKIWTVKGMVYGSIVPDTVADDLNFECQIVQPIESEYYPEIIHALTLESMVIDGVAFPDLYQSKLNDEGIIRTNDHQGKEECLSKHW